MHVMTATARPATVKIGKAVQPLGSFVAQAAREYCDKVVERLLGRELRKPWMKYREIGIIEDLLRALRPRRVLEWGAGFGTLHFARLLPAESRWRALEHDEAWAMRIRKLASDPRISIHSVPPDRPDWDERDKDGIYEDFQAYVEFPSRFAPYDFILVDGRARESCLERAHEFLAPHGVVVLHDANRTFRKAPGGMFPCETEFRDYRRWSGGLWIGSKGRPISSLIDLRRHGRIWRIYNSIGKGFHL